VGYLNENANIFNLNQTAMDWLNKKNVECGFADFMENALSYPPKGPR
jgi:carboxypeptidase D